MDKNKFFVLLPAYNVEAHIKKTVENIKKYLDNILVVDDGSTDNTLNIIKDLRVNFLTNKKNCGKGSALSEGFKYLSAKNIDYVITMDSDGQHSPDDIPVFLKCAEAVKADIIIGNRMHDTSNMPLIRYLTNRFLSSVVSKMTKCKIPDTQCGFRMISKKVIQSVRVESRRYDAESEIIIKAGRQGFSFASVPVKTIYSTEKSRINPIIDTIRFIKLVIKLFREEKKSKKRKCIL